METEEGLEKVQDALKVCSSYKDNYHIHRGKLVQYFKGSTPVVEWSFQANLIFARLDRFLDHLGTIEVQSDNSTVMYHVHAHIHVKDYQSGQIM